LFTKSFSCIAVFSCLVSCIVLRGSVVDRSWLVDCVLNCLHLIICVGVIS
jgi:hypothetical protein